MVYPICQYTYVVPNYIGYMPSPRWGLIDVHNYYILGTGIDSYVSVTRFSRSR